MEEDEKISLFFFLMNQLDAQKEAFAKEETELRGSLKLIEDRNREVARKSVIANIAYFAVVNNVCCFIESTEKVRELHTKMVQSKEKKEREDLASTLTDANAKKKNAHKELERKCDVNALNCF